MHAMDIRDVPVFARAIDAGGGAVVTRPARGTGAAVGLGPEAQVEGLVAAALPRLDITCAASVTGESPAVLIRR